MATIRASCPDCGDVELTHHEVTVVVCTSDGSGAWSFQCFKCRKIVSRNAEDRIIRLLEGAGCVQRTWSLPHEIRPTVVDLTHDDLLDFHALVNDDDRWTEALKKLG